MTATITLPRTTLTFTPTRPQVDAIRRYGIRVTPLDDTTKLLSRVCKCGRVEERTIRVVDTPRHRWETAQAIETLSGDDWRCAACRMAASLWARATTASGGSGNSGHGSSRKRRPSTHKATKARRPSIRQLRETLDYYQDILDDVVAGTIAATPAQINCWTAYRNDARAALRERGVRV